MENKQELGYKKVPILEEGVIETSTLPSIEKPFVTITTTGDTNRTFLYIAACTVNIVSFICGTSLGWTSPEIPLLKNLTTSPLEEIISPSQEGWVGSFLPLAAAIGPIGGGVLADKIGRKKSLLIANIPFFVAFLVNFFANSIYHFFLSRFLCGLGIGIIFTALPMYMGEIADDEVRGALGSFMQLFIVIGLCFSYILGPYVPMKTFNLILLTPPVVFSILFGGFVPDSPYYLIQSGRIDEALKALIKFRGCSRASAQKELEIMRTQIEEDSKSKGNFAETFKIVLGSRGLKMALFISLNLVTWQQLSGINIVLFYTQSIFTDAGASLAPEICTIITGVVQIVASGATPLLVERWGKRFLLMLSAIGMGLSQGVLSYFFYMKEDQSKDVSDIGWVPIVSLVVFIITYCLGFGPLAWAVLGELFPGNVKSVASSATASFCWILGFFITNYFGALTSLVGKSGSFGLFTICCFISAGFVYKFLPETTGKSLIEIQALLSGEN
ncbi:facilitated trehalose transporter Tret1-like [Diorhabda carinulata]|uniref:facilitated trehalose transporter Tret1-like n=1 Tax=Diorhabda carinulata TaxID=1163345 RepID=UPI0025A29CD3|nr:facilitated trehalose transporter Tret1-like [Diorhabda carinulata]XP_057658584.1 facilitated trehalose transporter Tret1-like [Diorhabda carinulata]